MEIILSSVVNENQGKGELSILVSRGHASVRLMIDCLGSPDNTLDVYLQPQDALRIVDALKVAAGSPEPAE